MSGPEERTAPLAIVKRQANRTTYIRSLAGSGPLTVWRLRDFVRALDAAGIPDGVKVEGQRTDGGNLAGLSVSWTEDIEGWPEILTGPSDWCAPEGAAPQEDADPGQPWSVDVSGFRWPTGEVDQ